MLKPTANFKLSKQTKRFMATFIDPQQRGQYKRDMIQAELAAMIAPPRKEKRPTGAPMTSYTGGTDADLT
jgi:hypothetical protein